MSSPGPQLIWSAPAPPIIRSVPGPAAEHVVAGAPTQQVVTGAAVERSRIDEAARPPPERHVSAPEALTPARRLSGLA